MVRLTKESLSIMEELGGELGRNEADRELLLKLKANGGKITASLFFDMVSESR